MQDSTGQFGRIHFDGLGWSSALEAAFSEFHRKGFIPGRVAAEDKHHSLLLTREGPLTAKVSGKLLHKTASRSDLPKVGDWVAVALSPGENKGTIHGVLPRRTRLSRKVPGRELEEQVLVANVDTAVVVQALDQSFNPRLLERHLLMVAEGGAQPVVVLNKADLCEDLQARVSEARVPAGNAPIIAVSGKTSRGINELSERLKPGDTVVFVGASGVGKSTLINSLYGEEIQATLEVRESDAKGRHTTTWREMILLPSGALVIDTPGMREFQLWLTADGLREAFPDIDALGAQCRFGNCSHESEQGCRVLAALESGALTRRRHANYLKLKREIDYVERARQRGSRLEGSRPFNPRKARR